MLGVGLLLLEIVVGTDFVAEGGKGSECFGEGGAFGIGEVGVVEGVLCCGFLAEGVCKARLPKFIGGGGGGGHGFRLLRVSFAGIYNLALDRISWRGFVGMFNALRGVNPAEKVFFLSRESYRSWFSFPNLDSSQQ